MSDAACRRPGRPARSSWAPLRLEHPLVDASGTFDVARIRPPLRRRLLRRLPVRGLRPQDRHGRRRAPATRRRASPRRASGMINAIGLENPGVDAFIAGLPGVGGAASAGHRERRRQRVRSSTRPWSGRSKRTVATAHRGEPPHIEGYELNVSCPNIGRRPADRRRSGRHRGRSSAPSRAQTSAFPHAPSSRPTSTDVTTIGPGRRRRRRRRPLAGQHLQGDGARPRDAAALPRQPHRRPVRPGDQAHRPAHGRRGRGRRSRACRSSAWAA